MLRLKDNSRGLSLLEVTIANGIFTLVMVALVSLGTQTAVFSKRLDQTYQSNFLAQERLGTLQRMTFNNLSSAVEADVRVDAYGDADVTGEYVRTTEIEENYTSDPNLKRAKITIKKIKINLDGTLVTPIAYIGDPMYQETVFSNTGNPLPDENIHDNPDVTHGINDEHGIGASDEYDHADD